MTQNATQATKRLEIRKYPNRRYYDATRSRHLTLEEIYSAIRDGYEITVTDSKSGEDITAKVLAQIIIELDSPKLGVFPVALLHRVLRSNEQILQDFISKYFNQALDGFLNSQRSVEEYFRQAITVPVAPAGADQWAKMMMGAFGKGLWPAGQNASQPPLAQPGDQSPETPATEAELRKSLAELEKRMAELTHRVAGSRKTRAKARRRRKSGRSAKPQ